MNSRVVKNISVIAGIIIGVGLILAIIGGMNGGFGTLNPTISRSISVKQFENIDVDVNTFNVELVEGKKYEVEYAYTFEEEKPIIEVQDGTLMIYSKPRYRLNLDIVSSISRIGSHKTQNIKITYPLDKKLGDVELKLDLGDCEIQGGYFNSLYARLDLGELQVIDSTMDTLNAKLSGGNCMITSVSATTGEIQMDLGNLTAKKFSASGLDISNSGGQVNLQGQFKGENTFNNDLGSLKISTNLPKKLYNYNLSTDLGGISIDGISGKGETVSETDAPNTIKVRNNMGDIQINFED